MNNLANWDEPIDAEIVPYEPPSAAEILKEFIPRSLWKVYRDEIEEYLEADDEIALMELIESANSISSDEENNDDRPLGILGNIGLGVAALGCLGGLLFLVSTPISTPAPSSVGVPSCR